MLRPLIALDRAAAERTSLYPSLPTMLVPVLAAGIAAYLKGDSWIWWVIGICVVLVLPLVPRRVDIDSHGISYIPLIPLRRTQAFRWSDIGPFEPKTGWMYRGAPSAILEAPLLPGQKFRVLGVWRSSKLTLTGSYGASPLGGSMTADALLALVESYRAPAGAPS